MSAKADGRVVEGISAQEPAKTQAAWSPGQHLTQGHLWENWKEWWDPIICKGVILAGGGSGICWLRALSWRRPSIWVGVLALPLTYRLGDLGQVLNLCVSDFYLKNWDDNNSSILITKNLLFERS